MDGGSRDSKCNAAEQAKGTECTKVFHIRFAVSEKIISGEQGAQLNRQTRLMRSG